MRKLSFGTTTSTNDSERIFIALKKRSEGFLTVIIGIDIDCAEHEKYSLASFPQPILPFADSSRKPYCRVEVIGAHFRANPFPARRRGGPGRIT